MSAINRHEFSITTRRLQDSASQAALKKAEEYKSKRHGLALTAAKAGGIARRICEQVYNKFEKELSDKFSSEIYCDLVSLTLESRINFFFLELKETIKLFLTQTQGSAADADESKVSSIPKIDQKALVNYVSAYGLFSTNETEKACGIARETIAAVIQKHGENIKSFQDLDEAGSYILSYVSDALEDKTLRSKIESVCEQLFSDKDHEGFFNAVEWGAIDCLIHMLKAHKI